MNSPAVFELDESERRPALVLQIDGDYLSVLVEQILDVFVANIRRQITHVNATLVTARHSANFCPINFAKTDGKNDSANEYSTRGEWDRKKNTNSFEIVYSSKDSRARPIYSIGMSLRRLNAPIFTGNLRADNT